MKRQKARPSEDGQGSHYKDYHRLPGDMDQDIPMQQKFVAGRPKYRNTLEAQIQEGDTLQAIAIRYDCSVADIKSLNKIERDQEIHARKTLRVPLTADTALVADSSLFANLPIVHKSGQSSPKHTSSTSSALPDTMLNEKLMVAAVSASPSLSSAKFPLEPSINDIILNTRITSNTYTDAVTFANDDIADSVDTALLGGGDSAYELPQPRVISGRRSFKDLSWSGSGSDLDMSWICLFVCILALCFAIPLVYIVYIAEHPPLHNDISNATLSPAPSKSP